MGALSWSRRWPWIAVIVVAALIAILVAHRAGGPAAGELVGEPEVAARVAPGWGLAGESGRAGGDEIPPTGAEIEDVARNEYPVDLERLRERLPGNLYWRLGAPSTDAQVVQQRAAEEQGWNELYGKILSGAASDDEIHRYYEHRRQLSEDYIEFASLVLEEYGDRLPERDRGLYELSITLHTARLAEMPRQLEDALARQQEHEKRREQWRQGQ